MSDIKIAAGSAVAAPIIQEIANQAGGLGAGRNLRYCRERRGDRRPYPASSPVVQGFAGCSERNVRRLGQHCGSGASRAGSDQTGKQRCI